MGFYIFLSALIGWLDISLVVDKKGVYRLKLKTIFMAEVPSVEVWLSNW